MVIAVLFVGTIAAASWVAAVGPAQASIRIRHIAAAPNCNAARAVGLAPSHRGQPGYYPSHDRDNDGTACEPWPANARRILGN
ncbi:excalibur calcium-binding domain-containing protein [Inquilinus sp. CAU 1745]|uniref:excalibur calcium-binding domain-containing protein n=1 Tax=Inquilinus sp. CAU 1745 TaxID=3140369 RepID=UPI00325B1ABA